MRFIHTADIHIGALRDTIPADYLHRSYQALTDIYRLAHAHSDGVVVIAGDLFDRKRVTEEERNLLLSVILKADKHDITTLIINGNHDVIREGFSSLRWVTILHNSGKLKNTHVADCKPSVVHVMGIPFFLVPPRQRVDRRLDPRKITARVKKLGLRGAVVVSHFRLLGSLNDMGKPLSTGEEPSGLRTGRDVLYWALGDVHKTQEVRKGAWYCGSPVQHKWSEEATKGVLLVDTDDPYKPTFLSVPSTQLITLSEEPDEWPDNAFVRVHGSASIAGIDKPNVILQYPKVSTILQEDPMAAIPKKALEHLRRREIDDDEAGLIVKEIRNALNEIRKHN